MSSKLTMRPPALTWLILGSLLAVLSLPAISSEPARPLSAHHVIVDGVPLAVWRKAPASAKRVVLLVHGRTWSARPNFDLNVPGEDLSLMDGLVEEGIATYALDMRGYGDTPRDASGWLTPSRAAADVIAVLEWIAQRNPGLPGPYLFGYSRGAMVAQLAAQQQPGRISGLIVFGYPLRQDSAVNPPGLTTEPARIANSAADARSDFIAPGAARRETIDAFVESALKHDPVRVDWRAYPEWLALDAARVTVPTLLVDAEHDPLTDPKVLSRFFAGLATADKAWVSIPGADHAAFLEEPRDYFRRAVAAFMLGERAAVEVISADLLDFD
ncbi:MAG TPA: alpha/beta fold hydrolase [Pseudomonadales bacterium]